MSATRGNATEAAVLKALVDKEFSVLFPFGGGSHTTFWWISGRRHFFEFNARPLGQKGAAWSSMRVQPITGTAYVRTRGAPTSSGVYFPLNQMVYLVPIDAVASFEVGPESLQELLVSRSLQVA
jgi:hypothetical protein